MSGQSWEGVPPELRRQADTPWFRSLLTFDPSAIMPRINQPILIVHGDLDVQVPPQHADKLGELAKARKKSPPVHVARIPGINHLLAPAKTGEVQEYGQLHEKKISPEVSRVIADWLMERLKYEG